MVQLIGFSGAEAEIRTASASKKATDLRVATNRYTDRGGQVRFFSKVAVATPQHSLRALDRQEASDEN